LLVGVGAGVTAADDVREELSREVGMFDGMADAGGVLGEHRLRDCSSLEALGRGSSLLREVQ
jgi:hypothetical protein